MLGFLAVSEWWGDLGEVPDGAAVVSRVPVEVVDVEEAPSAPLFGWQGNALADAVWTNRGLVAVTRLAERLGWLPKQPVAFLMVPDRQAVILRPADEVAPDGTGRTWEMVSELVEVVDARNRLRFRPVVLTCLGVSTSGGVIFLFGSREGESWQVLVIHPDEVAPEGWESWA